MRGSAAVAALAALVVFFSGCHSTAQRLCLRQACYAVEFSDTDVLRRRGLMFRDSLPPGTGMFFVFEKRGIYPFWMKNMKFPIDILWLDSGRRIVDMALSVPPCTADPCPVYVPSAVADYVLEIPAGDVRKYGFCTGDILR